MSRLGESFAPLSQRAFRILWGGQALSFAGDSVVWVAYVFAVIRLTGTAADIGYVLAAETVPRVLLTLAAGVWADRLPRNIVMRASDLARALVQAAVAVDLLTGHAQVWHLIGAAAAYGTATAFFNPAMTAVVPDTVPPSLLQEANALLGLTRSMLWIAGPALSGVLVALIGPGWVFAFDAVTFVGSAVCISLLTIPPAIAPEQRTRFASEFRRGWQEVRSRTWVWTSLTCFAVGNVAVSFYVVLGPLVAQHDFHGATTWGLWSSAFGVGSVIGSAIALRMRPRRPLVFAYLIFMLPALQVALLAGPAPLVALTAGSLGAGLAMQTTNTLWYTVLQQHIPREALSRVSAYDWVVSSVFLPLGYVIAGPVAAAGGMRPTLIAAASSLLALDLTMALLVPAVRRIRLGGEPSVESEPATNPRAAAA